MNAETVKTWLQLDRNRLAEDSKHSQQDCHEGDMRQTQKESRVLRKYGDLTICRDHIAYGR